MAALDPLAVGYDAVGSHGWYANLDPTVHELAALLRDGDLVIDYSGGTGIFARRILGVAEDRDFGLLIVDASPKFLRLALEKFRDEPRVAFRWLAPVAGSGRLSTLDEVVPMLEGQVAVVACTNAIHLYPALGPVVASWATMLRPGGKLLVQSGNIGVEGVSGGESGPWIIEDTVLAVQSAAAGLVREDPRFARFRSTLDDAQRMMAHDRLRRRYFLPTRPLVQYQKALADSGLRELNVERRIIRAKSADWYSFLKVYHEGVLGWAGGVEKIEGQAASPADVDLRLDLLKESLDHVLGGHAEFQAVWTYITAEKPRTA